MGLDLRSDLFRDLNRTQNLSPSYVVVFQSSRHDMYRLSIQPTVPYHEWAVKVASDDLAISAFLLRWPARVSSSTGSNHGLHGRQYNHVTTLREWRQVFVGNYLGSMRFRKRMSRSIRLIVLGGMAVTANRYTGSPVGVVVMVMGASVGGPSKKRIKI